MWLTQSVDFKERGLPSIRWVGFIQSVVRAWDRDGGFLKKKFCLKFAASAPAWVSSLLACPIDFTFTSTPHIKPIPWNKSLNTYMYISISSLALFLCRTLTATDAISVEISLCFHVAGAWGIWLAVEEDEARGGEGKRLNSFMRMMGSHGRSGCEAASGMCLRKIILVAKWRMALSPPPCVLCLSCLILFSWDHPKDADHLWQLASLTEVIVRVAPDSHRPRSEDQLCHSPHCNLDEAPKLSRPQSLHL